MMMPEHGCLENTNFVCCDYVNHTLHIVDEERELKASIHIRVAMMRPGIELGIPGYS